MAIVGGAGDTQGNKDLEKLQALAADPVDATWTFQHISGSIWRGSGNPVGDLKEALKNATIQLKVAGGGQLQQIA
jgi:hypothetical protein